jgi:hypothetical protein
MNRHNAERKTTTYSTRFRFRHGAVVKDKATGTVGRIATRFAAGRSRAYTLLETGNALVPESDLRNPNVIDFLAALVKVKKDRF